MTRKIASTDSPDGASSTRTDRVAKAADITPPIVGIGASAGGLEALEQFFTHVGPASGLAYVVVQHLDPDKKSLLVELLQRGANIPVHEISDRCKIEANHVYVSPPGFDTSILQGVLHLLKPVDRSVPHLPIDFFLRSLALDQAGNAAGVILSGMGSDGSLGLRALRENAGGCFVQLPASANFDSMPRSAISAQLADIIAPPGELPEKLAAYFANPLLALPTGVQRVVHLESALEKVLILVRAQTGHDFSLYKKSTVYRRIQRRMAIHQLTSVEDYLRHVRNNPVEAELLFKELLIGVTCFFRDPPMWQQLKDEVLPGLLRSHTQAGEMRAWVAACSTGEEAYSLAMVFSEVMAALQPKPGFSLKIFATDLEIDAVNKARQGVYAENIKADVSAERLQRFFTEVPGVGFRVNKDIRAMVVFAQQSIASDPPFGKLSILSCRNLLIYLEPELQRKLLPLFYESLLPEGVLVLGIAETVGQASDLFLPLGQKTRLFRRRDAPALAGRGSFPILRSSVNAQTLASEAFVGSGPSRKLTLQAQAEQLLLRKFAPAAVLVNAQGDIVYFSGKTGRYLEPAAGKANLNLFAMARAGLTQPLTDLLYRAEREHNAMTLDEVFFDVDGKVQGARVTVEPLQEPSVLKGLSMVVFAELLVPRPRQRKSRSAQPLDPRCEELMHQLVHARQEHQSTREEMQTSQEELKSANEELQSANEELTTSREELHSINQELQTVNAELQAQVDALSRASDDMENLLNSTDVATLFLDPQLHVRRFTPRTLGVFNLIPGDIGRPITDLVSDLNGDDLAADASEVLRTLMFKEKAVPASRGRWFMVRTMPYRTQDHRIDGVVITFTDISVSKSLEASLRVKRAKGPADTPPGARIKKAAPTKRANK